MRKTAILNVAIDFVAGNKTPHTKTAFSFDIFKKKNKNALFYKKL